ncbi:putative nudix hydrolase NudL [mine drainage metagenome]|uniref:Putative nudix hydrolase NudL n=1 Tax=mine drainage metagenome TaxID=410659 RepID=A0A1J5PMJ2_9ZZZZ
MSHSHIAAPSPRIVIDPESARLLGRDEALPPVAASLLSPAALRQRFAQTRQWEPELFEDSVRLNNRVLRSASVLIPLVARPTGVHLLLTRRNADLHEHAGQISFPGGRREQQDLHPAATALREAHEEIGLSPRGVELLGSLPLYYTASRYAVTPVVALLSHTEGVAAHPGEVSEVFEVPLDFLMDPRHHEHREWVAMGSNPVEGPVRRRFLVMPYTSGTQRYVIWGATAAMIRNLYRLLIA